ncbi:Helix-turn-helix domain-containing protein [Mariniphaga anaerophila]|uniref:Helix-turn-helix domain-containing protein n=1 Tax=Mariniphaga anaerophila TaxID=1484053 RepID=A0A1M5CZT2_9BACT|nr:helix-turn-helix transcriptional regulator [Mariniphaga anaerophila]SHF60022.1 Helix-turn-helix domain-containing protein [Mariniphaga anaerophila]
MGKDLIIYTPMYVTFFWALVLLITKRKNNPAKFFLGVFMSAAFLTYLSHAVFFQQNVFAYRIFDPLYVFASLSVYPLYYWYIKLLTVETKYHWINLRMLLPALIFSLATFLLYQLMTKEEQLTYVQGFLLERNGMIDETTLIKIQELFFYFGRLVFAIQVVFFLVLGRKLVLHYNKRIANFYSNLESKTIFWVNFLLYSFVATSSMSIAFNLIGREIFLDSPALLAIPSSIFSILLFFIGLLGYMQNHTVVDLEKDENGHLSADQTKYHADQLKPKLTDLFEKKKVYNNSELKITDISQLLGTNRSYVSALINNEFNCSFNEFVNKYRVEEAKKVLAKDINKSFSLNHVADTVGFGSVGTFIRVFKTMEGITPGMYRENGIKDSNL